MEDNNKKEKLADYLMPDYFTVEDLKISDNDDVFTWAQDALLYTCVDSTQSTNITFSYDTTMYADPYEQLEKYEQEKEKDEELRNRYPELQEAYEHYQLIKRLLEDEEIDENVKKRYEDFK